MALEKILIVDDDKNIIWHKAKNFIKNEPQELYQIKLAGNKTFVCDKNHSMITYRAMNKKNILDCKSSDKLMYFFSVIILIKSLHSKALFSTLYSYIY